MKFTVVDHPRRVPDSGKSHCYLISDNWDDYGYRTLFKLVIFDKDRQRYEPGEVKIMRAGMESGWAEVPNEFSSLPTEMCSLGQSQNYYETLMDLRKSLRTTLLTALRDCVADEAILRKFQ